MEKNNPPPYTPYPSNSPPGPGFAPPPPHTTTGASIYPQVPYPENENVQKSAPYPSNPAHPHPGFAPHPQQHTTTVTAVVVEQRVNYGPNSQNTVCPHCKHQIMTRVETQSTTKTHLYALLLCLIGCWPCVCIPYCVDSCMNRNHYCPKCSAFLGTYDS